MRRVVAEQFVCVWDDAVPETVCDDIAEFHRRSEKKHLGVSGGVPRFDVKMSLDQAFNLRDCSDIHLEALDSLEKCLLDYLALYPDAARVHSFSLEEPFGVQYYAPEWGYFKRHHERDGRNTALRHLVFMIYLNTVTDEGGTAFPNQNLTVDAVAGRVVIWPSDWTHAHYGIVSPTQEKFIMTGWYSYD